MDEAGRGRQTLRYQPRKRLLRRCSHTISITTPDYLFEGLPDRIDVGRYHSWVVSREDFPECLEITAMSDDGNIMALRHKEYDVRGVQFHPESILTPDGMTIISNWINTTSSKR